MAVRHSGYERREADRYYTPQWVFDALFEVEKFTDPWDCAPREADFDFLAIYSAGKDIVTNPPFSMAEVFCSHAIHLTRDFNGKVAMLLPHAFDTAKGRIDLWSKPFKAKYTLLDRIRWDNLEQKKAGPSSNHAWYVWDWAYAGKPFLEYLKKQEE